MNAYLVVIKLSEGGDLLWVASAYNVTRSFNQVVLGSHEANQICYISTFTVPKATKLTIREFRP